MAFHPSSPGPGRRMKVWRWADVGAVVRARSSASSARHGRQRLPPGVQRRCWPRSRGLARPTRRARAASDRQGPARQTSPRLSALSESPCALSERVLPLTLRGAWTIVRHPTPAARPSAPEAVRRSAASCHAQCPHAHTMRRHLNYANVIATLALVFAMSGGALAANHYLINSTKQINPKVLKKLKGNSQGKTGATGRTERSERPKRPSPRDRRRPPASARRSAHFTDGSARKSRSTDRSNRRSHVGMYTAGRYADQRKAVLVYDINTTADIIDCQLTAEGDTVSTLSTTFRAARNWLRRRHRPIRCSVGLISVSGHRLGHRRCCAVTQTRTMPTDQDHSDPGFGADQHSGS